MKRMLAALLALFVVFAPAARASGLDLLRILYQERGQTVVSPLSLNIALAMAAEGAKGETRAELLAAAGLTEEAMAEFARQAMALTGVSMANAVFVREGFDVLEAYDAALKERYQAERFAIGGADVNDKVNAWVKDKTLGRIERLLDQPPDPNLRLMLVNALALKADWSDPFEAPNTWEQVFHAADGDVDVDFMHKTSFMPYAELPGMRAVRLAYESSGLGLTVVLPDAGLAAALERLAENPVDWSAAFDSRSEVALALPKLSAEDALPLMEELKALGVQAAFGMDADFSGIDGTQDLMIGSVLQKALLDIDEQGTTAAAATSMGFVAKAAPFEEPPVAFTVDRPYILLLTDGETGLTLFAAAIDRP